MWEKKKSQIILFGTLNYFSVSRSGIKSRPTPLATPPPSRCVRVRACVVHVVHATDTVVCVLLCVCVCAVGRVIDSGAFQPKWSRSTVQQYNITSNGLRAQNGPKPNFFGFNFRCIFQSVVYSHPFIWASSYRCICSTQSIM